ncbi:MAG TPA: SDR family NAD(P)-dependent oxidoreductase [Candidatus Limnocylindrales bacterium]|jgi:dehydrogenase/reductase SDR family member 12|nr:SDR family NAD(P)-dependent oxidoreductase [Candidatus Limnocylindrales bacterium]
MLVRPFSRAIWPALGAAVDALLELSIVGSFSSAGPAIRRRLFDWPPAAPPAVLDGQTALVTGPTSGLGREVARALALAGARVVLAGRSAERLAALSNELAAATGTDGYPTLVVDVSSLASVRAAVEQLDGREERLDILVDNAGGMFRERRESEDGIELTLALMVVGPFALISGLMPLLRRAPAGRVISVASGGMYAQPVDFEDLEWRSREWSGPRAYAQAKRIQVALVREWARRLAGTSVAVNAMHPGWVDTPGLEESMPRFHRLLRPLLRNVEQGADTITWLSANPGERATSGRLYLDRRPRPFDRYPGTRLSGEDRRALWRIIAEMARR